MSVIDRYLLILFTVLCVTMSLMASVWVLQPPLTGFVTPVHVIRCHSQIWTWLSLNVPLIWIFHSRCMTCMANVMT